MTAVIPLARMTEPHGSVLQEFELTELGARLLGFAPW